MWWCVMRYTCTKVLVCHKVGISRFPWNLVPVNQTTGHCPETWYLSIKLLAIALKLGTCRPNYWPLPWNLVPVTQTTGHSPETWYLSIKLLAIALKLGTCQSNYWPLPWNLVPVTQTTGHCPETWYLSIKLLAIALKLGTCKSNYWPLPWNLVPVNQTTGHCPETWYLSIRLLAVALLQKTISLRCLMKMIYKGVKKISNKCSDAENFILPACVYDMCGRWHTAELCVVRMEI